MSQQAVGSALEAMQDDKARDRLAAGDFSGIGAGELDENEQGLVQRAAANYPEVLPFFTLIEMAKRSIVDGQSSTTSGSAIQLPAVQMHWNIAMTYALGLHGSQSG